jgi:hypothetical protein
MMVVFVLADRVSVCVFTGAPALGVSVSLQQTVDTVHPTACMHKLYIPNMTTSRDCSPAYMKLRFVSSKSAKGPHVGHLNRLVVTMFICAQPI